MLLNSVSSPLCTHARTLSARTRPFTLSVAISSPLARPLMHIWEPHPVNNQQRSVQSQQVPAQINLLPPVPSPLATLSTPPPLTLPISTLSHPSLHSPLSPSPSPPSPSRAAPTVALSQALATALVGSSAIAEALKMHSDARTPSPSPTPPQTPTAPVRPVSSLTSALSQLHSSSPPSANSTSPRPPPPRQSSSPPPPSPSTPSTPRPPSPPADPKVARAPRGSDETHDSGSTGSGASDATQDSDGTAFEVHEGEVEAAQADMEAAGVDLMAARLAGEDRVAPLDDAMEGVVEGSQSTLLMSVAPAADAMDVDGEGEDAAGNTAVVGAAAATPATSLVLGVPHPHTHHPLHVPAHPPPTHIPIPPNYPQVTHPDDVPATPIRGEGPLGVLGFEGDVDAVARAWAGVRGHTGESMEEEDEQEVVPVAGGSEVFVEVSLEDPGRIAQAQGGIGDHEPLAVGGEAVQDDAGVRAGGMSGASLTLAGFGVGGMAGLAGVPGLDDALLSASGPGVAVDAGVVGGVGGAKEGEDDAEKGMYWDLRVAAACKPKNPRPADRLPAICREDCGEDAYYVYEGNGCWALGVADGVGGWTSLGVDPSLFAWDLMNCCQEVSSSMDQATSAIDPERVLAEGYRRVVDEGRVEAGSSTACIVAVDKAQGIMRTTNLGDSGAIVIRPSPPPIDVNYPPTPLSTSPGEPQVVPPILPFHIPFRTTDLQHYFNAPYQLSVLPPAMRNDPTNIVDSPADAITEEFEGGLREGDVIVVGTDGVWDNLWEEEIIDRLRQALDGFGPGWGPPSNSSQPSSLSPPGSPASSSLSSSSSASSTSLPFEFDGNLGDPTVVQPSAATPPTGPVEHTPIHTRARDLDSRLLRAARQLCEDARDAARNARKPSPFARNARRAGHLHFGGKLDDVTLLIAYVYRTPGNNDGREEVSTTESRL